MSTQRYVADATDINFVLFEQLKIHEVFANFPAYAGFDKDTYENVVAEIIRVSEEVLGPVDKISDRQGVKFDGAGNVTTPEAFKGAWTALAEGGWIGIDAAADVGGSGLPHLIGLVTHELLAGSAMAFAMYPGLTASCARVVAKFAMPAQREMVATKMFTGQWAGTMCLTEAAAGSDVGSNRCAANRTDVPGEYLLEGEKIFISGGDQDLTENIIHAVLARTPDAPAGTRGLSLFLVPKYNFDAEGNLGSRNGAFVSGIEHKMGIMGSATCTLVLGADGPCKGYLFGAEGEGMPIMFHLMNEARIGVGNQGLGKAWAAYQNALAYAKDRTQGSSIDQFKNADAPRVAIVAHPDVRRNLMLQKCRIEALRGLIYRMGFYSDVAEHSTDAAAKEQAQDRMELLTPIVKGHGTDVGFDCTVLALQIFGGAGYTQEYPAEQHVRDAKITSVYEGTNGIQAMDLLGRKMRMKGGGLVMGWMADAQATCARGRDAGLAAEADLIEKAVQTTGATAMHLAGLGGAGNLAGAMVNATPFLELMGIVMLAVESLEQAIVAKAVIERDGENTHLAGKLLNVRFYVRNILPKATAISKSIQGDDYACLDERLFA